MRNRMNKLYNRAVELFMSFNLPKIAKEIKRVLNEPSLWTELHRKPYMERLYENWAWYLKYHEPCIYYNSYGFDIQNYRDKKEYLPYRQFRIERYNEDYPKSIYLSKLCILRDKVLFSCYLGELIGNKYVIPTIATIDENGTVFSFISKQEVSLNDILKSREGDVFAKKLNGECGDGCYLINSSTDIIKLMSEMRGSRYIVQDRLQQHDEVNKINPSCINTIRMITIIGRNSHKPNLFAQYMRVGCNAINDNRATGGVGVAISDEGIMQKYGVGHHKVETRHSVTNHVYEGTVIPFWNEAVDLVLSAHRTLPEIPTIGWDVAITPNGPVLIEGNDNWEISGAQDSAGGLKKKWYELHDA